jgi:hypothetical protein
LFKIAEHYIIFRGAIAGKAAAGRPNIASQKQGKNGIIHDYEV